MDSLPLYALLWGLPALLVLLVPRVVRKLGRSFPEPRMAEANFLVKMRLHNNMVESGYLSPFMLAAALVNLVMGYQVSGWHLFFGGCFMGLAAAHLGRFRNSRQLVNLLKKEEERAT